MRNQLLLVVASLIACSEQSEQCQIPHGRYDFSFRDTGGTCPPEIVDSVVASKGFAVVGDDADEDMCGWHEETQTTTEDGCTVAQQISLEGTETGIDNAQLDLTVTCETGFSCQESFTIHYTRVAHIVVVN